MATMFQIIALSSLDPEGRDTRDEPELLYPDALKTAKALKSQGKAFRVFVHGERVDDQIKTLVDLGALV